MAEANPITNFRNAVKTALAGITGAPDYWHTVYAANILDGYPGGNDKPSDAVRLWVDVTSQSLETLVLGNRALPYTNALLVITASVKGVDPLTTRERLTMDVIRAVFKDPANGVIDSIREWQEATAIYNASAAKVRLGFSTPGVSHLVFGVTLKKVEE